MNDLYHILMDARNVLIRKQANAEKYVEKTKMSEYSTASLRQFIANERLIKIKDRLELCEKLLSENGWRKDNDRT